MAADTYTATLGALLMGTGNDSNNWGSNLNTSTFQILEDAIAGILTITDTIGTKDLSTTPPPAGPSGARYWQLNTTGSLSGDLTIQVPNLSKEWLVNNACTLNGHLLKMKTPAGSAATIPLGYVKVWCDGSNTINVTPYGSKQIQVPDGTVAAPSHSWVNEASTGWYRAGTNDVRLSVGGADILQVTGAGGGTPSQVNVTSGNSLAFAGTAFNSTSTVPAGAEMAYAGFTAPTGWLFEYGQAISRTGGNAALFAAITLATTGTPSNGSPTITSVGTDLRNIGVEGAFIEGTGITTGTTIVSVTANTIALSQNATGGSGGEALRILPHGQGDGSTTFNVPDRRGRVLAARDNMGGTAANRLTLAQSQGILGTKLNATGGEEGHTSTTAETPSHNHGVSDPGHTHTTPVTGTVGTASGGNGVPGSGSTASGSSTTGITITNTGGGGAHNNIQPTGIANFIIKL